MQKKGKQIEIEWNMSPKIASKKIPHIKISAYNPLMSSRNKKNWKKKFTSNKKKSMAEYSSKCGNWNVNTHVCYSCAICRNWMKKRLKKKKSEKQRAGTHKNIMHTILLVSCIRNMAIKQQTSTTTTIVLDL